MPVVVVTEAGEEEAERSDVEPEKAFRFRDVRIPLSTKLQNLVRKNGDERGWTKDRQLLGVRRPVAALHFKELTLYQAHDGSYKLDLHL
ncbi:MAG: hypothetical protein H0U18_10935 [Pyrinomonadaceae bacterium]|nr:hypothetical protein [Pyrinomonadaceae bacterium]